MTTFIQRSRSVSPKKKAEVANKTGRVIRRFLGLTSDEKQVVRAIAVGGIQALWAAQTGQKRRVR